MSMIVELERFCGAMEFGTEGVVEIRLNPKPFSALLAEVRPLMRYGNGDVERMGLKDEQTVLLFQNVRIRCEPEPEAARFYRCFSGFLANLEAERG